MRETKASLRLLGVLAIVPLLLATEAKAGTIRAQFPDGSGSETAEFPGTLPAAALPEAPPLPAPANSPQDAPPNRVTIRPYGILVANAVYNTWAIVPGNIAFFTAPRLDLTGRQFSVSAGNTFVGMDIDAGKIGDWDLHGKFDFNLRGPTPVTEDNIFSPYFANVYIEAGVDPTAFWRGWRRISSLRGVRDR